MGLSRNQASHYLRSDDLIGIGMEADAVRRQLHPNDVVSYSTAVTVEGATTDELIAQIHAACDSDVAAVRIRNILRAAPDFEAVQAILRNIRALSPGLWIEATSVTEILSLADHERLSIRDVLQKLQAAGMNTFAGTSLCASLECSAKGSLADLLSVHQAAHDLGMRTEAGVVFGSGENVDQHLDILDAIREVQQRTGGFQAFMPIAAPPPSGRELDGMTAVQRLKLLAVSRIVLDNIPNLQASWQGIGLKVLQVELRFGANDLGTVPSGTGLSDGASEQDLRRIIRDAGLRPARRYGDFSAMFLN